MFRDLVAGLVVNFPTNLAGIEPGLVEQQLRVQIALKDIGWDRMQKALDDAMNRNLEGCVHDPAGIGPRCLICFPNTGAIRRDESQPEACVHDPAAFGPRCLICFPTQERSNEN